MQLEFSNIVTILLIAAVVFLGLILLSALALFFRVRQGFLSVKSEIMHSVIPRSLTISPQTSDIADLAIELWRLEKRLSKVEAKLSDDENKALQNSTEKIRRFMQKNDVEAIDLTGQTYNDGMNLDIIASEKDDTLKQTIIFDTHEPAVTHKGILIRKAKVIIHEK